MNFGCKFEFLGRVVEYLWSSFLVSNCRPLLIVYLHTFQLSEDPVNGNAENCSKPMSKLQTISQYLKMCDFINLLGFNYTFI